MEVNGISIALAILLITCTRDCKSEWSLHGRHGARTIARPVRHQVEWTEPGMAEAGMAYIRIHTVRSLPTSVVSLRGVDANVAPRLHEAALPFSSLSRRGSAFSFGRPRTLTCGRVHQLEVCVAHRAIVEVVVKEEDQRAVLRPSRCQLTDPFKSSCTTHK
jgi:hypothetical protein